MPWKKTLQSQPRSGLPRRFLPARLAAFLLVGCSFRIVRVGDLPSQIW